MKKFEKILEPHKDQLSKVKYVLDRKVPEYMNPDLYLFMTWAHRVGKGWYGFALGNDVPIVWAKIIHDFLKELETEAPEFEIHQLKLKFGGVRFYVDLQLEDGEKRKAINIEIEKLCDALQSDQLIY